MRVNTESWARHNIISGQSPGEVCVRPGIQRTINLVGIGTVVYGFTVRNEYTGEPWHYFVSHSSGATLISIYTDYPRLVWQTTWADVLVENISHAVVAGQLVMCATNADTLWSYTGQFPQTMLPKAWDSNPALEPLEIPRGIVCEWAGRAVYSDGGFLYFSEAGEPRMLFADNVQNPPGGRVYGIHTMSSGALALCTTTGTWALSREAATAGEFVIGSWQKVNDHQTVHYGSTVAASGRLWGVSQNGVRLIDTDSNYEAELNDPPVHITTIDPVNIPDYRGAAKLFDGEHGLIVSISAIGQSCFNFARDRTWSWLSTSSGFAIVGVGRSTDGSPLYFTSGGIWRMIGTKEQSGTVYGVMIGRAPTPPKSSNVVRKVHISTDSGGSAVVALLGQDKTETVPQSAPVWGTATYGDEWGIPRMRSRRFRFATRTDDVSLEVGATGPGSRIDSAVDIEIMGISRERPTN